MTWRPVVIMVLVILSVWGAFEYGFSSGKTNGLNAAALANQAMLDQIEAEKKAIQDKLNQVDEKYTSDMVTMQGRIDDAKRQAAQYQEQAQHDESKVSCDTRHLDRDWVRIHDTAARLSGVRDAEAASVDDGKTATAQNDSTNYTKKHAIEVITDNYSACSVYINQLNALQDYITTLTGGKE